ncbi:MAG: hypothetical protein H7840_05200 [Alphaproteobacteria bacterium]
MGGREPIEGGPGGIVERTDHAGDVSQRTFLGAALVDAARGLALEVYQHDVVPDDQYLTQVEISVVTGARPAGLGTRKRLDSGQDFVMPGQQPVGHGAGGLVQSGAPVGDDGQGPPHRFGNFGGQGTNIGGCHRLGVESGIAGRPGEGMMQLGRSLSQCRHLTQIAREPLDQWDAAARITSMVLKPAVQDRPCERPPIALI